jgi:hypothetical protein
LDIPSRKEEGKFKQGKMMSAKVCQRFLYSLYTLEKLKQKKLSSFAKLGPFGFVVSHFSMGNFLEYCIWVSVRNKGLPLLVSKGPICELIHQIDY